MGTQDNFAFAQEFVASGDLTDSEITFLWEPNFGTWQAFDVRINSSMAVMSSDLSQATPVFFGFGSGEQEQILNVLPDLG